MRTFAKNKSMEKYILTILVPALLLVNPFIANEPLPIGSDLPKGDVVVQDVSGKSITLKQAVKENGLLVMFRMSGSFFSTQTKGIAAKTTLLKP